MPSRKKPKPEPEKWFVLLDGKRVGSAETEASAKKLAKDLEKTLPTYINFDFEVSRQTSAHLTTA